MTRLEATVTITPQSLKADLLLGLGNDSLGSQVFGLVKEFLLRRKGWFRSGNTTDKDTLLDIQAALEHHSKGDKEDALACDLRKLFREIKALVEETESNVHRAEVCCTLVLDTLLTSAPNRSWFSRSGKHCPAKSLLALPSTSCSRHT